MNSYAVFPDATTASHVRHFSSPRTSIALVAALFVVLSSSSLLACASCGCLLGPGYTPGWESQGLAATDGFRFDLRYDLLDQGQIRSGSGAPRAWPIAPHEQELYTRTQSLNLTYDWSKSVWGLNVQLPFIERTHATNGVNYDGTDAGTSKADGFGDAKVIGRFMGLLKKRSLGLQLGFKLPNGNFRQSFSGGPIAGQPLDRGVQLGTGTTDLIFGFFHFANIAKDWNYFSQAVADMPLASRAGYDPGNSLATSVAVRYHHFPKVVPQLQLSARFLSKDHGINASSADTGGTTVYIGPGVTFQVAKNVYSYVYFQLPIYQYLNGYQLAPYFTMSIGTRITF
jgi:hypothetical protein